MYCIIAIAIGSIESRSFSGNPFGKGRISTVDLLVPPTRAPFGKGRISTVDLLTPPTRAPFGKGRISTADLLVPTSLDHLLFILKQSFLVLLNNLS
jgi:hypothetical protein